MKKRIVTLLLTLLTILSLLPTAVMAAESTGVGITPVTDPNLWTTRLNSQGQSYSYRPPTAAGRQLYPPCLPAGRGGARDADQAEAGLWSSHPHGD